LEEPVTNIEIEETPVTPVTTEGDEPVLQTKFASEVGGRSSHNLARLFDRLGGWFGLGGKSERDTSASGKGGNLNLPLPDKPKNRLGRGGWTALGVLLVMLPLLVALLSWTFTLNTQVQGYKFNMEQIQKGGASDSREEEFVTILTSVNLQMVDLQSTDPRPIGRIRLYLADYKQWAFTYGGLVPTALNNVYTIWLVQVPTNGRQPGPNEYHFLASFVNQAGGGHYLAIPENAFPSGFAYSNYNRLIVTEEAAAKGLLIQPEGPIRFALDLSKIKL